MPSCPVPEVPIMLRCSRRPGHVLVSGRCVGWAQGIVIGHEGRANVWISHRNAVVKAGGNHVRLAEVEEQLPWHDLYDSLRETDEQTYFDLSPPGCVS